MWWAGNSKTAKGFLLSLEMIQLHSINYKLQTSSTVRYASIFAKKSGTLFCNGTGSLF